jgi:hypothetical protein
MNKILLPKIREICLKAGWSNHYIWTYNDKFKSYRRIKFMVNGWRLPEEMKNEIIEKVRPLLKGTNFTIEWQERERFGYGSYDALILKQPI